MPSDWSYGDASTKVGGNSATTVATATRNFQNVRIIQNDGIVLQSATDSNSSCSNNSNSNSSTQEQIMQAEILFESPSTAEASLNYCFFSSLKK